MVPAPSILITAPVALWADQLLRDCQDVFETVGDIPMLGQVYTARADLEDERARFQDAVELESTALRLKYVHPDPAEIAASHHNLAHYLSHARAGNLPERRAHRLAAALLHHLTGNTHELTRTLRSLATELRRETEHPDPRGLPTTVSEVTGLVDAGEGVRFGDLVAALCPDPDTTAHALTDLLATAATLPDQPAEDTVAPLLTQWEPVIAAVTAAATTGHSPAELADVLDQARDNTDWAVLAAALRRVLAGDRDREQLLDGLDDVGIAILTATLDRLATDHGQDS